MVRVLAKPIAPVFAAYHKNGDRPRLYIFENTWICAALFNTKTLLTKDQVTIVKVAMLVSSLVGDVLLCGQSSAARWYPNQTNSFRSTWTNAWCCASQHPKSNCNSHAIAGTKQAQDAAGLRAKLFLYSTPGRWLNLLAKSFFLYLTAVLFSSQFPHEQPPY